MVPDEFPADVIMKEGELTPFATSEFMPSLVCAACNHPRPTHRKYFNDQGHPYRGECQRPGCHCTGFSWLRSQERAVLTDHDPAPRLTLYERAVEWALRLLDRLVDVI